MERMKKIMVAAAATIAMTMSAAVLADDNHGNGIGRGGMGPGGPTHNGMFRGAQAASTALLAVLHARLDITSAQEAAWQAFASAVIAEAADADQQNAQAQSFTSAVDALNARAAALKKQSDDAAAVAAAFATLYGQLTTSQRAIVDQWFTHGGPL